MNLHFAWTILVESAFRVTVLLCLTNLAVLCLRNASAAVRHCVWTLSLTAALILPIVPSLLPAVETHPALAGTAVFQALSPLPDAGVTRQQTRISPGIDWRTAALFIWMLGAAVVAFRSIAGFLRLRWMTAASLPFESGERTGSAKVFTSDRCSMPITWGLFRTSILLPSSARTWDVESLRVVLLHEAIHIQRADWLNQLLARVACIVYWFHPLVWRAASAQRREAERSCDDAVVNFGIPAAHYAERLLALARNLGNTVPVGSAVCMAHPSGLETRLHAILDTKINRAGLTRRRTLAMSAVAVFLCVAVCAVRLNGQANNTRLHGTVSDASRAVIPGAKISATNVGGHNTEITTTNSVGEYDFSNIPPGTYSIDAVSRGFRMFQRKGVEVSSGAATTLDIAMELGGVNEAIEVLGQGPQRNTAAISGTPQRIRVGGNVQATKLISQVKPDYPASAQQQGTEGSVLLKGVIGTDGRLLSLTVLNSLAPPELAQSAISAVQQWRYQPTLLNGEPVEVVTTITVNFRLAH
jgi:TonB family protein